MNAQKNYNLADLLGIALAPLAQAVNPAIDVESCYVPTRRSVPMPVKAIFNLKTEDMVAVLDDDGNPVYKQAPGENSPKRIVKQAKLLEKPILASKVYFDDGSWTVVKNSGEDTVDVEEKVLADGKTVKVATDASKERAIAYAVVKRVFGRVDPLTKEVKGANLGRRFEKVIAASIDQNVRNTEDKSVKVESTPKKVLPKKSSACKCNKVDAEKMENAVKAFNELLGELAKKLDLYKTSENPQQGT